MYDRGGYHAFISQATVKRTDAHSNKKGRHFGSHYQIETARLRMASNKAPCPDEISPEIAKILMKVGLHYSRSSYLLFNDGRLN